jgi:hypothetical protein
MFSAITATQINVDLTILTANVAVIDTVVDALAVSVADLPTNTELTTALGDIPTNSELTTALSDLPTNSELTTALSDLPTNSELATALDPLPTAAENAAAVLAAAVLNPIDANVQEVNDVTLTGDGSTTPWGPA